ncbi:MAG TPA: GntR family transcriptional regulator [Pseudonocardia sp.]|jgi:DNA-binding GntR family transcriptional regulator
MATGAAEQIRADIEEAILSGRLPTGSRVNADHHARRLGVSHIPVREALHALAADGWIVQRRHQGAFVRAYDPVELADLFEARSHLEGSIAVLAAQRRTAAQLAVLEEILVRQAGTTESAELARINAEFHVAVAECAQNTLLVGYLRDLTKRVRFYFLPAAVSRRDDSLAEHRQIVDAIQRRDADLAKDLVLAHIADTRLTVQMLTGQERPA